MLQSFSSQHALCHFVNLNRISRTDKRASMQLGAASLCPTPPPSHSCWLSLGLKGRGRGRSIIILGQLPSSSPKPQSDTEFSSVWVYCTHKWLAHRQRETLTALTILTATFTNVNANTFTENTSWVFSVDFFIFFASFALPACPSNIATVNNKRSKLAALTTPLPTPPQHPPAPVHLLQGLQ